MKVPQIPDLLTPILIALRSLGGSGRPSEVVDQVARDMKIPEGLVNELLPSGVPRFANRVAWSRFYLFRAGLLASSKQGVWSLTEKGRNTSLSASEARELYSRLNQQLNEERKRRAKAKAEVATVEEEGVPAPRPPAYREELRGIVGLLPPEGFERLCQRLLREAGFVEVFVTGRSGDGGIDGHGTLQVNPLVSFKVLFQCKRYVGVVGAGQVRDFRGALQGRADKGILLTTGTFSADARKEATREGVPPIELVDGEKLMDMFVSLELGLRSVQSYEVDRMFFAEFDPKLRDHS